MSNFPNDPFNQSSNYAGGSVYVQPNGMGGGMGGGIVEPAKMSIMAVAALVMGIIGVVSCCIPIISPLIGALAVFLAIIAIVSISSSHGRKRGKGLAIAGFACGLISVLLGVVIVVGASKMTGPLTQVVGGYAKSLEAAQAGDVTAFNNTTNANTQVSAAEMQAFVDSYRPTLGDYKSIDPSMMNIIKSVMVPAARTEMTTLQQQPAFSGGQLTLIPSIWTFDKGDASVLVVVDTTAKTTDHPAGLIEDIIIVDGATNSIVTRLSDVLAAGPKLNPDGTLPVKPIPDLNSPTPDAPDAPEPVGEVEPASNPS